MRTTTMDPLAEKYYHISPYAWCGNNPVNRIDPDGRDPKNLRDWMKFGKSVYNATTAVVTLGFQGSAKVEVVGVPLGVSSNAGSFDLIGIRDGNFTPGKNTPTIQQGGEISIGIFSVSQNTTITDNGATTTKTESATIGIPFVEGTRETTTEVKVKDNEVISTDTQNAVKFSEIGVKAGLILGVEAKIDVQKIWDATMKLLFE